MADITKVYEDDIENVLQHFGIKGMHWGRRKTPQQMEAHTAKKAAKELDKKDREWTSGITKHAANAINRANNNEEMLAESRKLLTKLSKAGLQGHALAETYSSSAVPLINKYLAKDEGTYNPSKTKHIQLEEVIVNGQSYASPVLKDIHPDDKMKHSSEIINEELLYTMDSDNILQHFGIPGMKWGHKKGSSIDLHARRQARLKKAQDSQSDEYKESRKLKSKNYKTLSNKEIKTLNERMQLERSLRDLKSSNMQKGLDTVKTLTAAGTTVASLYALSTTPLGQAIKKALIRKPSMQLSMFK